MLLSRNLVYKWRRGLGILVYLDIPYMANPDPSNTSQYTVPSQKPGQVQPTSDFADLSVESHITSHLPTVYWL